MKELIDAIIESLNKVEVKGKDNLDYLLGSILALEQLSKALEGSQGTEEAEGEADGSAEEVESENISE